MERSGGGGADTPPSHLQGCGQPQARQAWEAFTSQGGFCAHSAVVLQGLVAGEQSRCLLYDLRLCDLELIIEMESGWW